MCVTSNMRRRRRGSAQIFRTTIICVSAAIALMLTGACSDGEDIADPGTGALADESSDRDILRDDPAAFEGEQVAISAIIDEVVHPNAFFIQADDPNGDRYLVMHQKSAKLDEGDRVQITGRVEALDVFELEEELDVDLDMPTFERYQGDYGIIATNIDLRA